MSKRAHFRFLLVGLLLFTFREGVESCGPFFPTVVFFHKYMPDYPFNSFAAGNLGVIQPTYARSYLVVAYRHMMGIGMNKEEQKAVLGLWLDRLQGQPEDQSSAIDEWLKTRAQVVGTGPPPTGFSQYGQVWTVSEYLGFSDILSDAFATASRTLTQRIRQFGTQHSDIVAWVDAQDKVFGGHNVSIPDPPRANLNSLLRADRFYQIAAANFYIRNFDEAQALFSTIAADTTSPWRTLAPYLVARTLVRKASFNSTDDSLDTVAYKLAEIRLNAIIKNEKLREIHPASRRLLGIVKSRYRPVERTAELVGKILKKGSGSTLKQNLSDYTWMLDRFLEEWRRPNPIEIRSIRSNDLTDWICSFQSTVPAEVEKTLARWRESGFLPWLVAILSKARYEDPFVEEVLAAADRVPSSSPGFASVRYHMARLLTEKKQFADARAIVDSVIGHYKSRLNRSSLNLLRMLKLRTATALDEYMASLWLAPVQIENNDGFDFDLKRLADTLLSPKFVEAPAMNSSLPLDILVAIASEKSISKNLRRDLVLSCWVRGVLLDRGDVVGALAAELINFQPSMRKLLAQYEQASTSEQRRFAAVYLMLKFPGLTPAIRSVGLRSKIHRIDDLRDNWWCTMRRTEDSETMYSHGLGYDANAPDTLASTPAFLTQEQLSQAETEWRTLQDLGSGPTFLCTNVMEYAQEHPDDPRVPEALHLAVRSTRYGCKDSESSRLGKRAFQLLHTKYPKSKWTNQTKYWY